MSARAALRERQPAREVGWSVFAPFLVGAALLYAASFRDWGPGGDFVPWLGALTTLLCLMPALRWKYLRHRRPDLVGRTPFLPVLGVLYGLYFAAPVLLADRFLAPTLRWSAFDVERTLVLVLCGWIALTVGWYVAGRWLGKVPPIRLELDWLRTRRTIPYLLGVGFAAMIGQRVLDLPGGLVQPLRFLQMLFQAGLALALLMQYRGELSRREARVLWLVLIPGYLFLQVGHGSVAQLAYAGLFLMFVVWGAGRRVPLFLLVTGALLILLLRGHVHAFRGEAWDERGTMAEAGVWERSVFFVELLYTRFNEEPGDAFGEAFDEVSARVAHLGTFAHVVGMTPSRVPYWKGQTYSTLSTTWIPRILWPNKPVKEVGQDFGHRYGLLGPQDRTTAVNLPIPVEMYANFGAFGMCAGMAGLGALYFLLHRLLNGSRSGEGTLVVGCILFSRLILIESDFTLVFGAVIQYAVLLVLFFRWLAPRRAGPREGRLVQASNQRRLRGVSV